MQVPSGSEVRGLLDGIAQDGLVRRASADADARGVVVALTAAGVARLTETAPVHLRGVAHWFVAPLDEQELAVLARARQGHGRVHLWLSGTHGRAAKEDSRRLIFVWANPFAPPDAATGADPERYRDYLRDLYRQQPRLFTDWAKDAAERDVTLLGDDSLMAMLYDALCRVARAGGWSIGTPLVWTDSHSA